MNETMPPDGFTPCDLNDGSFANLVGPLYMRREESGLCFGFRAGAQHRNAGGAVHGGMLMTLADQVLGLTVREAVDLPHIVTVALNCNFVSGAMPGDWIEGRATIVRTTRSLVFVQGNLTKGDAIVMTANGIWKRLGR